MKRRMATDEGSIPLGSEYWTRSAADNAKGGKDEGGGSRPIDRRHSHRAMSRSGGISDGSIRRVTAEGGGEVVGGVGVAAFELRGFAAGCAKGAAREDGVIAGEEEEA